MLINNQLPVGEHRHNYTRLVFLVGTLILFIGHIVINQLAERGNNALFPNVTLRAEELALNDITPSDWVYRSLDALNYFWQLAWLFYSLSFIFRRSLGGYLYLSPNTLTPTFSIVYVLGFVVQSVWLLVFNRSYFIWTWTAYLVSFLLLSLALFIINNNITVNKKVYETDGLNRDIWFLRFFAQNGVAFFACWTAVRFVLALDTFLQFQYAVSIVNAGTISLALAAVIAAAFFFGPNINATAVDRCAYQFSPWIVFLIFFWGVVENNWVSGNITRNNIIAAVELGVTGISAVVGLAFFAKRYQTSQIDQIA